MSPDKAAAQPSPKGRAAADRSCSSTDRIEFSRLAQQNLENYPNSTGNLAGQPAMPWVQVIPEDGRDLARRARGRSARDVALRELASPEADRP
jgi:hypothetical protein